MIAAQNPTITCEDKRIRWADDDSDAEREHSTCASSNACPEDDAVRQRTRWADITSDDDDEFLDTVASGLESLGSARAAADEDQGWEVAGRKKKPLDVRSRVVAASGCKSSRAHADERRPTTTHSARFPAATPTGSGQGQHAATNRGGHGVAKGGRNNRTESSSARDDSRPSKSTSIGTALAPSAVPSALSSDKTSTRGNRGGRSRRGGQGGRHRERPSRATAEDWMAMRLNADVAK